MLSDQYFDLSCHIRGQRTQNFLGNQFGQFTTITDSGESRKTFEEFRFFKERRRLDYHTASRLLRCGLNLRFLKEIKIGMKAKSLNLNLVFQNKNSL